MSPQPEYFRSPGHVRRQFTKSEVARMFAAREEGLSDSDIARRFGVSTSKITTLIGRKGK